MSRINVAGIKKPEAVEMFVDEFIATGETAGTIRTIWYQIKHKIEPWKPDLTEKKWSDDVNNAIGQRLWSRYLDGETSIYEDLGIKSKAFSENDMPVVLFCEKQLPDFDEIADELEGCIYLSSGQIPNFEIAQAAKYLSELDKDIVYLFGMIDYDPAGLSVYRSLVDKMSEALRIESGYRCKLVSKMITFDDFEKYDSYGLSSEQIKRWEYGERGIELDTVHMDERQVAVKKAIYETVSSYSYEEMSVERARRSEYNRRLMASEEYHLLADEVKKFEAKTYGEVEDMPYEFNSRKWQIVHNGMIKNMTTLKAA